MPNFFADRAALPGGEGIWLMGFRRVQEASSLVRFCGFFSRGSSGFFFGPRSRGGKESVTDNYEGREFDSRTRLVVGRGAWLGPSSEGGFIEGVSGFLGRSSSGFSWSESAGAGTSSEWAGNDQPCRVRPAKALVVFRFF